MNAIKIYRFSKKMNEANLTFISIFLDNIIFLLYNSIVPYNCTIGKNTRLNYGGIGVVIHKNANIGSNVLIGTNVTIGGNFDPNKKPLIGNNVYISTGAKVLGAKIGDYVIIGANCVVTKDVPSYSVVGGIPSKIIREVTKDEEEFLRNLK